MASIWAAKGVTEQCTARLRLTHRQYVRYKSALDDTLIGIEHLNSGYLTPRILDSKILAKYLEAIEDDLEETAPEFELVFTNVYQYYSNSLISFTNIIDDLLLQLPILIKLKVQVPMSLFSIKMAPVPLDAETYLGEKREYTQIILETELIALTKNNYIPLTQTQISLCAKIGYMYYCEYAHLLKKCTEHMSCISKTACFLVNCASLFPPVWTEQGAETTRSCLIHWSSIIKLHPQRRTGPNLARKASTNQRPSHH